MDGKTLETLEFDKIVARLADLAATPMGREAALALAPSSDPGEVRFWLAHTDEAVRAVALKGAPPFGGVADIRPALRRARIGGVLSARELLDVANLIAAAEAMRRYARAAAEAGQLPHLAEMAARLGDAKDLGEEIRRCIDENGEVTDEASGELLSVRREIRIGENRIRDKLDEMVRSPSVRQMLQDAIVTLRGDRFVLPVKQEYRARFGGIVHDQSASGATLFIEPEAIVALNNRLKELRLRESREIERILRRLSGLVGEKAEGLSADAESLGVLDFWFAKAALAAEMKATRPEMNDAGVIRLPKARHPLLPADLAVPIDVELGGTYTTMIITGPNTGGKTVSLKTIGLLSLMAMAGLFVPAAEGSRLAVFDGVYADIGDEQSIEQNLSTFSGHMKNLVAILRRVTPRSLVLLDELGAGTDPAEGSALAVAILEHLHGIGCRVVSTTHFGELKAYAYNREGIVNASMEFDDRTLRPTYRLLIGVPGRSNALAIARRLGLPESIVRRARGEMREEELNINRMLASLQKDRRSAEEDRQEAERLRREAEALRRELEEERRRFAERREKLAAAAREEARSIVARARREAEDILAELRRLAREEAASIKEHRLIEASRRLEELVPDRGGDPEGAAAVLEKAEPGAEVRVRSLGGQTGRVVEAEGDAVTVQVGAMKIRVRLTDLEPARGTKAERPSREPVPVAMVRRTRDAAVRTELDLRGRTLEEALAEVERFLDEAVLANLHQVRLIHGKGTGALRSGIQDYLRRHKHVRNFRLGEMGEGGSGVTVAELK